MTSISDNKKDSQQKVVSLDTSTQIKQESWLLNSIIQICSFFLVASFCIYLSMLTGLCDSKGNYGSFPVFILSIILTLGIIEGAWYFLRNKISLFKDQDPSLLRILFRATKKLSSIDGRIISHGAYSSFDDGFIYDYLRLSVKDAKDITTSSIFVPIALNHFITSFAAAQYFFIQGPDNKLVLFALKSDDEIYESSAQAHRLCAQYATNWKNNPDSGMRRMIRGPGFAVLVLCTFGLALLLPTLISYIGVPTVFTMKRQLRKTLNS